LKKRSSLLKRWRCVVVNFKVAGLASGVKQLCSHTHMRWVWNFVPGLKPTCPSTKVPTQGKKLVARNRPLAAWLGACLQCRCWSRLYKTDSDEISITKVSFRTKLNRSILRNFGRNRFIKIDPSSARSVSARPKLERCATKISSDYNKAAKIGGGGGAAAEKRREGSLAESWKENEGRVSQDSRLAFHLLEGSF
jgi:hypothetical protein